jgi:hypothetical protein
MNSNDDFMYIINISNNTTNTTYNIHSLLGILLALFPLTISCIIAILVCIYYMNTKADRVNIILI